MIQESITAEARRQGLSARALALAAGVPVRTMQRFFQGNNELRLSAVDAVLKALDLTIKPAEHKRPKRKVR